jgi:hypothetical protein
MMLVIEIGVVAMIGAVEVEMLLGVEFSILPMIIGDGIGVA